MAVPKCARTRKNYLVPRVVAMAALAAAPAAPAFDVTNPPDNVEAWVKLQGDTSGATVFHWNRGLAYAMPAGRMGQALFGLEGLTILRFRKLPEGGYEAQQRACGVYYDARSGVYVDSFVNPLTSRRVELKPHCGLISGMRITARGISLTARFEIESSIFDRPYLLDWQSEGSRMTVTRTAHTRWRVPPRPWRHEITVDAYRFDRAALTDAELTSIEADYSWTSQTEWLESFGMTDVPGSMLWVLHGKKFASAEQLPAGFARRFREAFPGVLERPWP